MKNYVQNRWKFLILPLIIIIAGVAMFAMHGGFNFDIEFKGGVRMQLELGQEYDNDTLAKTLKEATGADIVVQKGASATQTLVKTSATGDEVKGKIIETIQKDYPSATVMSESSASASFGEEVQRKALVYALIAILLILVYIAFRFEWRSAVMAVIALTINVIVMFAVYAITNIAMNTTFIAAMLTVIGYSINNTIVIFDRIRENMKKLGGKRNITVTDIVNTSIGESMGRTINSTITTLITIVLLYIIGVAAVREFALPLIVGIVIGAYTSIFMAGPFWGAWKQAEKDAKAAAAQSGKRK